MAEEVYLNIKDNIEATKIWNNFIEAIIREHGDYYTWHHVTTAMADYNANYKMVFSKNGNYIKKHYIRFGSEAELTAFILRYS